ncbi:Imm49 family immunity protein [Streptomyces fimicarius]|uniref:Imm49 family immunity protein n=1 Tax=Streptomyces griseus TaxID=1911 RepID=UPI0036920DB8
MFPNALLPHKEHRSTEPDIADSRHDWGALAPLAMACFARDAGFPIEVESDHLPKAPPSGRLARRSPT